MNIKDAKRMKNWKKEEQIAKEYHKIRSEIEEENPKSAVEKKSVEEKINTLKSYYADAENCCVEENEDIRRIPEFLAFLAMRIASTKKILGQRKKRLREHSDLYKELIEDNTYVFDAQGYKLFWEIKRELEEREKDFIEQKRLD